MIAIEELVAFMNARNVEVMKRDYPSLVGRLDTFAVAGGRKYIRIAHGPNGGMSGGRYVHCFVDAETGGVYKAAGWKAPALNGERYNLLDRESFDLLKSKWDPYTSYLYKR